MNTSGHPVSAQNLSSDGGKGALENAGKFGATIWKQKALRSIMG